MKELTLFQILKLKVFGKVYIEHRTEPGWRGSVPFYRFICPKHGAVESYRRGYNSRLDCPKCLEEAATEAANR